MKRRTLLTGVAAALAGCSSAGRGEQAADTAAPTDTATPIGDRAEPTDTPPPCSATSSTPAPPTPEHPARAPPDLVVRVARPPVMFSILGPCGDEVYSDGYMGNTKVDVLHATPNDTGEYLATAWRHFDDHDMAAVRFVNGTLAPGVQLTIDVARDRSVDIEAIHY